MRKTGQTILLKGNFIFSHITVREHEPLKANYCFVCFVALRPKSTAMVIAGLSFHLTTLFFPWQALTSG